MTWHGFDGSEPKDGTQILAARYNGCGFEYAVVWWTGNQPYPWEAGFNSYPEDRFDQWARIRSPRGYH